MNTIKFSFFFFLLTISLPGFTQERVNRPKLKFEASSDTLTKATGWAYNETLGEWIDFENVISNDKKYKEEYASLDISMRSYTKQNFNFINFKQLTFKGLKYYILTINQYSGKYTYPEVYIDWNHFEHTVGFIFTENEFQKLNKIDSITELKTKIKISVGSKYEQYNETLFLDLIQTALNTETTEYAPTYLFPVMKSKEGMIRFYLPDDFSKYNSYNFDSAYFEVDPKSFSKIILK